MKILITAAGGGNTENLVRSLRESTIGKELIFVGTNVNKFELAKSICEKNYVNPGFNSDQFITSLENIIKKEKIDFVIVNHENEIEIITNSSSIINDMSFLPSAFCTNLCINKFKLNKKLAEVNLNVPRTFKIKSLNEITDALNYAATIPVWIRVNEGSSSVGAAPMYNEDEVKFWIRYWVDHKGVEIDNFTISEFLPGRDIHCFSIWNKGEMIIGKCVERLEYLNSKITLSGTYSSPSVCTMVNEPQLIEDAKRIIKSIDINAKGAFGIDFKQNEEGKFCLTEINIGRFPRINYLFNMVGPNMAEIYVQLGMGKKVIPVKRFYIPKCYLFREVDTIPILKIEEVL
jgi:carbamoyl-phosphate synthase large subunit